MPKETIHIACNIDTSYVKYCIVMLTSLFENNQNVSFHIHIITEKLSSESKSKIVEFIENRYHQKVQFYYVDINLVKDCPRYAAGSHISLAAYYRIFLGNLLPLEIHKVLYLDCDLVVIGSIEELWKTNLKNFSVACVEDMWSGKEDNYKRLHYPSSDSYFNSGVLLINLDYWREKKLMYKALDYIAKNGNNLVFYDQDVLNALLHNSRVFLPFRYNVQDGFLRRKRRIRSESIEMLDQELLHPVIIHYTGGKKPWQYKSLHPYKSLYFYYLDLTPWKGERPIVPFSYKLKKTFNQFLYFIRLARPKYRKCIESCPRNSQIN